MPFTEAQEQVIKDALPDLYQQLADLQEKLYKYEEQVIDLKERLDSMENWRKALRLRIRQEGSAT
jgi:predicted  nucleic acid-binding Zn-ribbon protein